MLECLGRFNPLLIGAGALPIRSGSWPPAMAISFNPLLIGAGALPFDMGPREHFRGNRFNPLLIGAGALPFPEKIDRKL